MRDDVEALAAIADRIGFAAVRQRLEGEAAQSPLVTVMVLGEFKQGKSALVNALAQREVSPVDAEQQSAAPVFVRHGERSTASVLRSGRDPETIDPDGVRGVLFRTPDHDEAQGTVEVVTAEWRLPDDVLLIDMPGGGLASPAGGLAFAAARSVDVILFVTDAARELTAAEVDFMKQVRSSCTHMACALTKTDLYVSWRRILDLDENHLRGSLPDVPVLAVAPPLAALAEDMGDPRLEQESGVPALRVWFDSVYQRVSAQQELPLRRTSLAAVDELDGVAASELDAMDPTRRAATRERLESAKAAAERVLSGESFWLVELREGFAEAERTSERGLQRLRRDMSRRAYELLMGGDPAANWDEFGVSFMAALALAASNLYSDTSRALETVVETSVRRFASTTGDIMFEFRAPELTAVGSGQALATNRRALPVLDLVDASWSKIEALQMIGMQTRLLSPIGLLVAAVMGRKILRMKQAEHVGERHAQALQAVDEYLEDFVLDQRDVLVGQIQATHLDIHAKFVQKAESAVQTMDEALDASRGLDELNDESLQERRAVLSVARADLASLRDRLSERPSELTTA